MVHLSIENGFIYINFWEVEYSLFMTKLENQDKMSEHI